MVAVYFALGKTVALPVVFLWIRYLAIVLLPAGIFAGARMLGLRPYTAAAAAVLAPLISTDAWYGLDYSSYLAVGRGLYPQSVAAVLLLPAIGAGVRAIRTGRGGVLAGILLGLTGSCHFIYGWIAAVTLCPGRGCFPMTSRLAWLRLRRIALVALVSVILSAFQLLPVWLDRAILNHSRWEESFKWDSFGAATVLKALFTGELLDHGRLPVLSLLALAGAVLVMAHIYRTRRLPAREGFVLIAAVLWTLVFFGRKTWGPLCFWWAR